MRGPVCPDHAFYISGFNMLTRQRINFSTNLKLLQSIKEKAAFNSRILITVAAVNGILAD